MATDELPLLVFAHADEAAAFADVPHLVTGVGKINAATELTRALCAAEGDYSEVVVLGTAGVVADGPGAPELNHVYRISAAVQHDYSLPSPRLALDAGSADGERTAVIATGDVFVQNDAQRAHLASMGAALVDMETYAYAVVCERLGVPLSVYKVPSDFADSSTTGEEWDEIAETKSEQLRRFWHDRVGEPGR